MIAEPLLRELLTYWRAKKGAAFAPPRSAVDPAELPPALLPFLLLAERTGEGSGLRYRLVGTSVRAAFGFDPTGRDVGEVVRGGPAYRDYLLGLYAKVVALRRPFYCTTILLYRGSDVEVETNRLMLPLAADGQNVDMILTGQVTHVPPQLGDHPWLAMDGFRPGVEQALD